jgi:Putative metal-binding motif
MRFNFTSLPFNRLRKSSATLKQLTLVEMLILTLLVVNAAKLHAQPSTVFTDDFSTNTNAVYTTSGAIGSSAWTVLRSGGDMAARRNETVNQLELTNDASATANVNGWVLAYTLSSSFSSPYNTTLNSNTGDITWTFNMRHPRTDPSGFGTGNYGAAFILAGTSSTTLTTGTGYAVITGQSGTTDPIRLVRYSAGPATSTNIIVSNTPGLTDFGTDYLSIKVVYTPSSNNWQLFLRNDGSTSFADPATGTLVSQGNIVDNTYTGTTLTYMGALWNTATAAGQTAFYDNVTVTSTPPCTPPAISAISNSGPNCDTTATLLNVTASGTAPLAYNWTGPAGFTSTDEDPLVATPQSGYYVVAVSNACGTVKDSTLASIAVSSSWYPDLDNDTYGNGTAIVACVQPSGYVLSNTDCNDTVAAINPGATEICNTLDDDCDALIDNDDPSVTGQTTYYADLDNDGYGAGAAILSCTQPANTSLNNTDCSDGNPFVNPGEPEACGNSVDDNCDTFIDENCGTFTYYRDFDNDGFGYNDSAIVVFDSVPELMMIVIC